MGKSVKITPGMAKAMGNSPSGRACVGPGGCGQVIPKYQGAYPKNCPNCTTPLVRAEVLIGMITAGKTSDDVIGDMIKLMSKEPKEKR